MAGWRRFLVVVAVMGLALATGCVVGKRVPEPPPERAVPPEPSPTQTPTRTPAPTPTQTRPPTQISTPRLRIDQGSFRADVAVGDTGTVRLVEQAPLSVTIDAAPIFAREGWKPRTVQLMLHDGCYYMAADGFQNLWEITPEPGTRSASYRPIPVPKAPIMAPRLSRYGPVGRACLRLEVSEAGPWYFRGSGELEHECR